MSLAPKVSHQAVPLGENCGLTSHHKKPEKNAIIASHYQDCLRTGVRDTPTLTPLAQLRSGLPSSFTRIWHRLVAGLLVCTLVLTNTSRGSAERESGSGFLATWKLLSQQEKQQFIAGYLQGWRDAAKVTDIAIAYVKTNPSEAVAGLERIKELYNLEGLKPPQVVSDIDLYYSDPDNYEAPLSRAVTASQQARRR